jgi:hypothetical protein
MLIAPTLGMSRSRYGSDQGRARYHTLPGPLDPCLPAGGADGANAPVLAELYDDLIA